MFKRECLKGKKCATSSGAYVHIPDVHYYPYTLDGLKIKIIPQSLWDEMHESGRTKDYKCTGLFGDLVDIFDKNHKYMFSLDSDSMSFWVNQSSGDEICVCRDF